MKKYNFDEIIDRRNSDCEKWDNLSRFGNPNAIPLWVADTDFRVADFIIDAIKQRTEHQVLAYSFRPKSYFTSITNWLSANYNWNVSAEEITSSPGVVAAITTLILALSNIGDKVVVQPPVYFPFFTCVKGVGRQVVENPLILKDNRYYFDFEDLKNKLDANTKLLILCNPHNPGGMVWSSEELRELGEICLKNGTIIISDEIHSDLVFDGRKHTPFPLISSELAANCAVCMAPNKTFNIAGLASAFLVIPNKRIRVKYERWLNVIHINSGNIYGNIATQAAYNQGSDWMKQLMEYLTANRNYLAKFIANNLPKVKMIMPEATFLAWLDFSNYGIAEKELSDLFIHRAGVVMNKGSMFGTGGEGFFRLNFGCPRSILTDGLVRIEKALKELE